MANDLFALTPKTGKGIVAERMEDGMTGDPPIVQARRISKSFGGTRALLDVDLDILPGETHALVGENGSGKSTLIRILSGFHAPERGATLRVRGTPVGFPLRPDQPRELGWSFLHQGLALVESASILENLRVESFKTGIGWRIRWREERDSVRRMLVNYGLELDPMLPVARISQAGKAIVALLRALDQISGVDQALLVLDEPTAHLPHDDIQRLFRAIRKVVASGSAVLLVTHRLEEVYEICDRVTVIRDGIKIGTQSVSDTPERELITMILGRSLDAFYPSRIARRRDDLMLQATDLSGTSVAGLSFDLHKGEILGMTGLAGMGQEEVPYLLIGALPLRGGQISIAGKVTRSLSPSLAKRLGIALLPGNRAIQGGAPMLTIRENVSLPTLQSYKTRGWLSIGKEARGVQSVLRSFEVRPPEPERLLTTLSGGNQQKALLAKWIQVSPRILLLHEPTQGVDIGSRREIFAHIQRAVERGTSVIVVSSDYEELAHLCNRVLVLRHGRIWASLDSEALSADRIAERCYATGGVASNE